MTVMERCQAQMGLAFQARGDPCMRHTADLLHWIGLAYVDVMSSLVEFVSCIDPDLVVRSAVEVGKWEFEADQCKKSVLDEEIEMVGDKLGVVGQVEGLQGAVDKLLGIDYYCSYLDSGPAVNLACKTAVVVRYYTEAESLKEFGVDLGIGPVVV